MSYDPDKTWADFEREVQHHARSTIRTIAEGLELYKDLLHYKGAKTNAQIATDLGRTEADVDNLADAITALKRLSDFGENVAVAQGTYLDDLRTFS